MIRRVVALALIILPLWAGLAGAADPDDTNAPPPPPTPTTTPIPGGNFGGDTFGGPYPPSRYSLKGRESITNPNDTFNTIATRNVFDANIWVSSLTMSETDWGWSYTVAKALRPHIETLNKITELQLTDQFKLRHFVLAMAAVWAALLIASGRLGSGLLEGALSAICFMLAMHYVALQPLRFFDTSIGLLQEVSTAATTNPDTGKSGADELTAGVHRGMIAQPWEWLSFGRPVMGTPCQVGADRALEPNKERSTDKGIIGAVVGATGNVINTANPVLGGGVAGVISGQDGAGQAIAGTAADQALNSNNPDDVKKALEDADCDSEAEWYAQPDGSKLYGASLVLITSIVIWIMVTALVIAIVFAQAFFALIAVIAPVVPILAAAPGQSRDAFWKIVSFAAKCFVAVVIGSYMLVLTYKFINALLSAGEVTENMETRMGLILLVALGFFFARKKIMAGAARAAGRGVGKVGSLSPSARSKLTMAATTGAGMSAMNALGALDSQGRARQTVHAGQNAIHQGRHALNTRTGRAAHAVAASGTAGTAAVAAGSAKMGANAFRRAGRFAGEAHARLTMGTPSTPAEDGRMGPGPGPALPTGQRVMGELGPGPNRVIPMGGVPTPPVAPKIRYQESSTYRGGRVTRGNRDDWTDETQHRLLRVHHAMRAEGLNRSLLAEEIDPAMPEARRQRIAGWSSSLWEDEEALRAGQRAGALKIHGQSAEERLWLHNANLTDPAEMKQLLDYHKEGRLRSGGRRIDPHHRPSQVIRSSLS